MRPPPDMVAAVAQIVEPPLARTRKQKPTDERHDIQERPGRKRHQCGEPARTPGLQRGADRSLILFPRIPALGAQQQQSAQAAPRLAWRDFRSRRLRNVRKRPYELRPCEHPYLEGTRRPACDAVSKPYQGLADGENRTGQGRLEDHSEVNELRSVVGTSLSRHPCGSAHDRAADVCQMLSAFHEQFFNVARSRSEEHTSELQSPDHLVCRLLLEK